MPHEMQTGGQFVNLNALALPRSQLGKENREGGDEKG